MIEQKTSIQNKLGLHARASMKLIDLANRFQSEILIKTPVAEVNAKSIMNLMALAAAVGTEITISADGPDEDAALKAIIALIDDKFGEGE